jgi:hypothetical protein
MRYRVPRSTAPSRRVEVPPPSAMSSDAAILDTLMEPSMEAAQQSSGLAASGWVCPRCGIVWGPRVKRCTCEPPESAGARTEITEAAPRGMSYNDVRREAEGRHGARGNVHLT